MTDRILTFLAGAFYHFGIFKSLQENYDCDIFSIVDVDDKPRKFFQQQKLVNFKKVWFYRDYVQMDLHKKPDISYLDSFEKNYGISLWRIAYGDKKFYKYNRFYKFNYNEILLILEQTCKFYEEVLNEVKPNCLIMGLHDSHRNHLLYDICRAKKIKVLMLGATRFGYRAKISDDEKKFEFVEQKPVSDSEKSDISLIELKDYLKKFDHSKAQIELRTKFSKTSKRNQLIALLKFFIEGGSSTTKKHFSRYGLSRLKLIKRSYNFWFNRRKIKAFVNQNSIYDISNKIPFVYYPLHSEPERALSIAAPYFTNQIEVITNIAKSLPVEYTLYVKEHPAMLLKGGSGRKLSFYKEILKLPNVKLLHPSINRDEILEKCSLVITINGTAGFEAAFFGKPTITFIETDYSSLPSIHTLEKIEDLPNAIKSSLEKKVKPSDLYQYVEVVNNNSFEYNKSALNSDFYSRFFYRGFVIEEKEIFESEMKEFLKNHKDIYDNLASEFIKKIKLCKEFEAVKKIN